MSASVQTASGGRTARPDDGLLRTALKLDAIATGPTSVAYLVAAGPLGDLIELPPGVLRAAGAFLLLFAVLVWVTAQASSISAASVWVIVAINVVWGAGSIAAAIADWGSPTTVGAVLVVVQATFGMAFGCAEYIGLRRVGGRQQRAPHVGR